MGVYEYELERPTKVQIPSVFSFKDTMAWLQLSVTTDENTAPDISEILGTLGAVSVTYVDAADQPVYEPEPGETRIWKKTRVIGLFEPDADMELIKSIVSLNFTNTIPEDWQLETLDDQVWERTWMEYYRPMKFGEKLWVCPTGQEISEPGTVCLTLDPGLAFGTGTHPTTALCLKWLSNHDLTGKSIIDYGCGSGILAIAAILLGANHACAVDIDPQALTATRDNAKKNHLENKINCYQPDQFPGSRADMVLANILAQPLIELSQLISGLVKPAGQLILSGILNEQAESVIKAYTPFIAINPPIQQEDWCRLDGRKIDLQ